MTSAADALPPPSQPQKKKSPPTTEQQRSSIATKPSPKDLKTSVPKQKQPVKLPRSSPPSKRPRPPVSSGRTNTNTTTPHPCVNFIHSVTDFPPLKSSPTTTTSTTTTTRCLSSIAEHVATRTNHNNKNNNPTNISILTKPAAATVAATTASTASKLQPTAREFHPPLSLRSSNQVTTTAVVDVHGFTGPPTVSASTTTTTTTKAIVPSVDINMFPPLVSSSTTPPPVRTKSEHSKIQSNTATHAPPPIKKVAQCPKQKLTSRTLPTGKESLAKESLPKPQTAKRSAPHQRNDSIRDNQPPDRAQNEDMGSSSPFDLLRRYQNNNNGTIPLPQRSATGGQFIQRLTPKIKKFSSLKKKVLEERLRQWQTVNGIVSSDNDTVAQSSESTATATVCVYGFANEIHDCDDDDDEYDELVENLRDMATKIGPLRRIFIPRPSTTDRRHDHWPAFVEFGTTLDTSSHSKLPRNHNVEVAFTAAQAAVQCWSTLVLGGETLSCRLVGPMSLHDDPNNDETTPVDNGNDDTVWQSRCLAIESSWTDRVVESSLDATNNACPIQSKVLLNHILTDDDLDDDDCLEESLNDIRMLASKYGAVESIVVVQDEDETRSTNVMITFSCDATQAILELNKIVFGGQPVVATLASSSSSPSESSFVVKLRNIITDDDLEDESCLEESLNDVKELATQYGSVQDVSVDRPDDPSKLSICNEYAIQIHFLTKNEALDAIKGFDGMLIGGQTVTATIDGSLFDSAQSSSENVTSTNCHGEPKLMYSGDKIISERFAECKRAPKIVNPSVAPRPYAKLVNDESIKPTIIEMLSELMRLQRRAMEENNVKAKRRLVMGLREVARGIRSHKVKLVIMANNLDEYGVIDQTVQDIVDLAKTEEVPIYYELNKKGLGKAVGKSIKVAIVGVQSADGAHQQYKKLMNYAAKNF